ncbi:replication protein [Streptococcus oralis]|uniref:Replication protein n=1 Tax=Streptococcus oralis TaxID=1303 RepID=A0A139RN75_STROR|nr:replication initiator protein A [Streptococcus oralis]KXU16184.1 replication protein [Streptococcus oralis]
MKISEVRNNSFYQMPKWLYDPPYNTLSDKAKQIYMFFFDRRKLSEKNKWYDENGDVYIKYKVEKLMEKLQCSNKPIIAAKQELAQMGLIREVRVGVNQANKIYIFGSVESTPQEVKKVHVGSVESTPQEVEKVHRSKTDSIKTNLTRLIEPDGAGGNNLYSIGDTPPPPNDLQIVHDWIVSEFGRLPTPFEIEDLQGFLKDHKKEVIKLAIKECVGNGKPYLKYLSSILRDWKQKGLVTVELVENRPKPKTQSTTSGSVRAVRQVYDDPLPF